MIDKKGRIFGKINIIDFVLILIVVCVLVGVGYKLFAKSGDNVVSEPEVTGTVYATFKLTSVVKEVEGFVEEGDRLLIDDSATNLEVVSATFEDAKSADMTADGEMVVVSNPLYVDGYIKVKAEGTKTSEGITVDGIILRVNEAYDIATEKIFAGSKIVDLQFEVQE